MQHTTQCKKNVNKILSYFIDDMYLAPYPLKILKNKIYSTGEKGNS